MNAFVALGVNLEFLIEDEWREWMVLGYDRAAPPAPDEFWRRRYQLRDPSPGASGPTTGPGE